jgi:hypothetical protein
VNRQTRSAMRRYNRRQNVQTGFLAVLLGLIAGAWIVYCALWLTLIALAVVIAWRLAF